MSRHQLCVYYVDEFSPCITTYNAMRLKYKKIALFDGMKTKNKTRIETSPDQGLKFT